MNLENPGKLATKFKFTANSVELNKIKGVIFQWQMFRLSNAILWSKLSNNKVKLNTTYGNIGSINDNRSFSLSSKVDGTVDSEI